MEGLPLLQVEFGEIQQLGQILAATMVATDRLVESPPDQLYRVRLRTAGRQRMQLQPLCTAAEILLNLSAGVACVVVYAQMQLWVTALDPTQLFKQLQDNSLFLFGPLT